jgi:hypothetical protein
MPECFPIQQKNRGKKRNLLKVNLSTEVRKICDQTDDAIPDK